jgi:DMSO/TMAO reductase YedYZ heme-binding membrane subunit
MSGGLPSQFWWWVARATGIVAWAMATASVAWGLTLSGRLVRRRRLPAWLLDLHRYLGTLTVAFLAIHVAALVADSYVSFGARELFVPMGSEWRPGAVTWGVLAMYGLIVIQVTSWGMRYLPRKVWHGIHLSSYAVFAAATVHGALSGADRANPLLQGLAVAGVTLVVTLTVLRVLDRRREVVPAVSARATVAAPATPGDDRAAKIAAAKAKMQARKALAGLPPPGPGARLDALEPEPESAILGG